MVKKLRYISILRGINVSGQKKVKMADLKVLYECLGFASVSTYIQTGNVIFESESDDRAGLIQIIEKGIEDKYKFRVPVDIRTNHELGSLIDNCPLEEVGDDTNGAKVLVTFLRTVPSKESVAQLMAYVNAPDRLIVREREAYLYCPNGYGKSKLTNSFLESKLGCSATTRNWNSIKQLYELST